MNNLVKMVGCNQGFEFGLANYDDLSSLLSYTRPTVVVTSELQMIVGLILMMFRIVWRIRFGTRSGWMSKANRR